ncbi:MAG: YceI family protein [Candidatus Hydrogenedentota bacterium]
MKVRTSLILALATIGAIPAGADTWTVDPVHSSAIFKVHHLGASNVYGAIPKISGTVDFSEDLSSGAVDVSIAAESVTTNNGARDTHLKGPDFFNAKEFPNITFKSTAWKRTGDHTADVTGDFTLLGKTESITAQVTHTGTGSNPRSGKPIVGFETIFEIDRTKFGMNYGVAETGGVGKEVMIIFAVECGK